jgi:hypothetical protein
MEEPPYEGIWEQWKAGKVVPFLGAGASLNGHPTDDEGQWNPDTSAFLPRGCELANFLARVAAFPSNDEHDRSDLARVSSYYVDNLGRVALRDCLRKRVFVPESRDGRKHQYNIGPLHEFLAAVPIPQVIVVTNYDTIVEQAFVKAGKPFDVVVYPAERKDLAKAVLWWKHGEPEPRIVFANQLDIDLRKTTVIFKMHGTIQRETAKWDNLVITEEDYVEFLYRMITNAAVPALLYEFFLQRSFLFLGYSLRDWNLRVILKNLSKCFAKQSESSEYEKDPSWAIQVGVSKLEERLWLRRNVNIFECDLDEFANKMWEVSKLRTP